MNRIFWATTIFLLIFCTVGAERLQACEPVALDQSQLRLRDALNRADMMFIGQVQRVTMRRWTIDDQMGLYEQRLLQKQAEGSVLTDMDTRFVTFSDATARLSIATSMKLEGLDQTQPDPIVYAGFGQVDVNLLDHGGFCDDFPRPCPWDIKAGDWVAVALEHQPTLAPVSFYCIRIDHPDLATRQRIEALRGNAEPAEIFWPFLGDNYPDWPFGDQTDAPASPQVSVLPRRRPLAEN